MVEGVYYESFRDIGFWSMWRVVVSDDDPVRDDDPVQ